MDPLSIASSVLSAIDIAVRAIVACSQYSNAVLNARADVVRLQTHINGLKTTLDHVKALIDAPDNPLLLTSRDLADQLEGCRTTLQELQAKLELDTERKLMKRVGLRALAWPFSRDEVEKMISNLERHQRRLMDALQVDQTTLLLDIRNTINSLSLRDDKTPASEKSHFIMPFPRDEDFVNRPTIQQWLREEDATRATRIALVGLGGFGKSQIAMEFAYETHDLAPKTSVFWVRGSTKAAFEESYRSLADRLELPERHDPKTNILALVCSWLQRIGPWLMILDSADDMGTFFGENVAAPMASYLPKTNGKILITSRSLNVAERLTGSYKAILRIPTMSSAESLRLVQTKLASDFEEDAATELVELLDCVPLAVNQAVAYINRRQISISSYMERFRASEKRKTALLNHDGGDIRRHESVSNSVVVAWQLTFEQICQESVAAANLLSLMSLFHPKNIPYYLLLGYSTEAATVDPGEDLEDDKSDATLVNDDEHSSDDESDSDETEDMEDDLDILLSYCLVAISDPVGYCEMHSLVQFCTQRWLVKLGSLPRWKSLFLAVTSTYFPDGSFDTWAECQMFLPHVEEVLEEQPRKDADALNWSLLLTNVSVYLANIGKTERAKNLTEKSLQVRKRILGPHHAATLTSMSNLSIQLLNLGRISEAENLQEQVLATRKVHLGDHHADTLLSIGNLASIYAEQGRWNETLELEVEVMEARKKELGTEHPDTLLVMSNLASTYSDLGLWKEAADLQKQVIETRKAQLGSDHPDTLLSMSNMAIMYRLQGRHGQWQQLEEEVLQHRKAKLGDDHPDTLTSMANLAVSHYDNDQLDEAEKLGLHVAETRKTTLGEDHPDTLAILEVLASIQNKQGQLEEAEKLGARVMELRKAKLGNDHPDTLLSMHNMASLYWEQGRLDKAEELEVQVFEARKATLGAEHPHTLASMHNLAFTVQSQSPDRLDEALALIRACIALRERVLGVNHPSTMSSVDIKESWEKLQESNATV